jgi:hypothetical protein
MLLAWIFGYGLSVEAPNAAIVILIVLLVVAAGYLRTRGLGNVWRNRRRMSITAVVFASSLFFGFLDHYRTKAASFTPVRDTANTTAGPLAAPAGGTAVTGGQPSTGDPAVDYLKRHPPPKRPPPAGTVRMQAPLQDASGKIIGYGEIKDIPSSQVQHYLQLGARIVPLLPEWCQVPYQLPLVTIRSGSQALAMPADIETSVERSFLPLFRADELGLTLIPKPGPPDWTTTATAQVTLRITLCGNDYEYPITVGFHGGRRAVLAKKDFLDRFPAVRFQNDGVQVKLPR